MVEHRKIKKAARITENVASDSDDSSQSGSGAARMNMKKLNEQPVGKNAKGYDPNRYVINY